MCWQSHEVAFEYTAKEGERYVGNLRFFLDGYMCSGMLETKYENMCQFSDQRERDHMMDTFSPVVEQLTKESVRESRYEEIAQSLE